jgi:hypothetical protein
MSVEREEGSGRLGWESLLSYDPNFNPPAIWTRFMSTFEKLILSFGSEAQRSLPFLWFVSPRYERHSPTPRRSVPS